MKRRSPIHAYKRLLADDHDWDYAYLIALEKKKLQRMHDCIMHEDHLENNAIVTRDIAICIRLIDIFMEDDAAHNTWLHQSFSGDMKFRKLENGLYQLDDTDRKPIADYPVYVNVRNERRFFRATPIRDAQAEGNRDKAILSTVSLRQQKALHLYHLIREYNLLTWWDNSFITKTKYSTKHFLNYLEQITQKEREASEDCVQGQKHLSSNNNIDLQELSPKHRQEYFEVKPIFDSLGIELMQEGFSDKPDFRFTYEGKNIGLEATCCYPPDALIHKNNKDQNKYEIGDKGVRSILEKYKKYKIERKEWVSLFIGFYNGLYYTLRDTSLTKKDIEKIGNEVIEEIENRIEDYHCCKTIDKKAPELCDKHYKYVSDVLWDEPQEGKVLLGCGGHAMPARTIELEPLRNAISNKESKLAEYKQLKQNKEIDEYWLCVNLPIPSERLLFDLDPFEILSGYTRIYITQFDNILRIK